MSADPRMRQADGDELRAARVILRPIANPFALGFVGLAVATIVTSSTELGWSPPDERVQAAVLVLAFAPALQLLASVFGFLARDAVAATGMGVLAATWLSVGTILLLTPPHSHSPALGLLLFVAGTAIVFSAAVAAQAKLVPALVLALTAVRLLLTGVYEISGTPGWAHAAGWAGVALCAAALYGALSLELEDMRHRTVLPTLRRRQGREALEPRLGTQVRHVAGEAGVREQL